MYIMKTEVMHLKKGGEGYIGEFRGRKVKGEM